MSELSPYFIQRVAEHQQAQARAGAALVREDQLDLREYWRTIRRHLTLISTITAATVLIVTVAVFVATPRYTATAVILIEPQPPQVLDMKQLTVESPGSDEHDYYKTQYSLLRSASLAAQVIKGLGLARNRLLDGSEPPGGLVGGYWSDFGSALRGLLFDDQGERRRESRRIEGVDARMVNRYLADLSIQPDFGTRLVNIAFSTSDPNVSAMLANAHASAYVNQGMELRAQASQAAQQFLEHKLVELKDRVEKSEAALNSYRHDKGIVEFSTEGKNEILLKRLEDLNRALTEAETKRIAQESQADLITNGDYDALPEVVDSVMVQALRPQLAALEAQYASMASRYSLEYRPLAALKAKLDDTRSRLNQTVTDIVRSVKLEHQAAVARERELEQEVAQEKARALALNDASLKDGILARDVDTNRQLYESVLKRMKEMGVAAEVRASNVSVIDNAIPPTSPSSPRKGLAILLSTLLGLAGAVGVAFFVEYLDDTFKTAEEIERHLRLPMLASVPDMRRRLNGDWRTEVNGNHCETFQNNGAGRGSAELPSAQMRALPAEKSGRELAQGRWALAMAREAYRTIRSQVLLSRPGEPPKTVLITSAVAGEGKSITAVNTAITFAHKGRRVLLIDADLRRSRCHELLRRANPMGLSDVLAGQANINEVINDTGITNLFFISAGAVPPDPPELLGSSRMSEILNELATIYDHIIIDSAPVMPVSDSVVLSRHVDGVILIAGRTTSRQLVKRACMRVGEARGKTLGIVLNQVSFYHASYYPYNGYHGYSYHSYADASRDSSPDGHVQIVFE